MASTNAVFAWVGFFLVNIGFIALVSWGTFQQWILGVVLCLLYAGLLFGIGRYIKGRIEKQNESNESLNVIMTLLYLLGVLAFGVSGLILSLNVFDCGFSYNENGSDSNGSGWNIADIEKVPPNVQAWYNSSRNEYLRDFVYLESEDVLLYFGENEESESQRRVWSKTMGNAPYLIPYFNNPSSVVSGKDEDSRDTACLIIQENTTTYDRSLSKIACTNDGVKFRYMENEIESESKCCLFWENSTVWFTGNDDETGTYLYGSGALLYSLNPITMETELYSTYTNSPSSGENDREQHDDGSCDSNRRTALATLFLSALPVFALSLLLLKLTLIPSLPLSTYAGLTAAIITLYVSIKPDDDDGLQDLIEWWLVISSTTWLLTTFLFFAVDRVGRGTLNWSLNFAGLVFLFSWLFITRVPITDIWWRWIIVNIFVLGPLVLIGTVTNRIFVTFLGACVFVMDAFKIGAEINSAFDSGFNVPIYFVVFAIAGGLVISMGWVLNKRQNVIEQKVLTFLSIYLGFLKPKDVPTV